MESERFGDDPIDIGILPGYGSVRFGNRLDQPPLEQKMRLHDDPPEPRLDQCGQYSFNCGTPNCEKHDTVRPTGMIFCLAAANRSNSAKASGSGLPWAAITTNVSSAGISTRPANRLFIPQSRKFRHLGMAADVRRELYFRILKNEPQCRYRRRDIFRGMPGAGEKNRHGGDLSRAAMI